MDAAHDEGRWLLPAAIVIGGSLRESDVVAAAGVGLAVTIRRLTRVAPTSSP